MSLKIRRLISVALIATGAAAVTAPAVTATAGTQHAVAATWVKQPTATWT